MSEPNSEMQDREQIAKSPESPQEIANIVECLLFVADHPVTVTELAKTIDVTKPQVEAALKQLTASYEARGLRIQRLGAKIQLVTASEMADYVERFLGLSVSPKLSTAAMEVLGIIAYKQPLTRPEVEAIRGVNSDGVLRSLLSKGLVEEVGRLNTVGHPIQYGTTFEFLQYFGLSSLDQLPELEMEDELIEPADALTQATESPPGFVQDQFDQIAEISS